MLSIVCCLSVHRAKCGGSRLQILVLNNITQHTDIADTLEMSVETIECTNRLKSRAIL